MASPFTFNTQWSSTMGDDPKNKETANVCVCLPRGCFYKSSMMLVALFYAFPARHFNMKREINYNFKQCLMLRWLYFYLCVQSKLATKWNSRVVGGKASDLLTRYKGVAMAETQPVPVPGTGRCCAIPQENSVLGV